LRHCFCQLRCWERLRQISDSPENDCLLMSRDPP
jgi:hypothetical protein